MGMSNIARRVAMAVAVVSAALVVPVERANASCAGPTISLDRTSVAAGEVVEVRGRHFGTDCNDTGGPGPVLGDPATDVVLRFAQQDAAVVIMRIDAARDYGFVARCAIPASAQPGPASIEARDRNHVVRSVAIDVIASPVAVGEPPPPTIVVGRGINEPPTRSGGNEAWPWLVVGAAVLAAGVAATRYLRRTDHA